MPELAARHPRAFVTGAAGFIGSHVVKRLVDEGVHVTALVLPGDAAPALRAVPAQRLTKIEGDLADAARLERAMRDAGATLVMHLAAIYAIWHPRPRTVWDVNVGGTRRVLAAARAAGVGRVVHTSSIAAVGHRGGKVPADEGDAFDAWDGDDYVRSKYVSELEALAAARDGFDVVAVNPAFPFGADDTAPTPTGKLVRDMLSGRLPFTIEGGFNAVDVRDVAEGHLLAALFGASGQRYILGGDNVGYRDFAERVAAHAGMRAPRLVMPTRLLVGAGRVSEWLADHVTRRVPLMTRRSAEYLAGRWLFYSTARAEAQLGYRPRPIEDAIAASVAWFRSRL